MTAREAPRWERTADARTWQARPGGAVLTVSRCVDGGWRGLVEAGGRWARSEGTFRRRLAAQAWCSRALGGQR